MIRSAAYRFLQHSSRSRCRITPSLRLSAGASSIPHSPQNPSPHKQQQQTDQETPSPGVGEDDGVTHKKRSNTEKIGSSYETKQARVLRAALPHVPSLGWSESAIVSGAKDVGVSPSIVGSFSGREAALVEFFMDDCLQKLIDRIDSGEEFNNLMLSDRLVKLICIRLEMQVPYISKWPEALSIQVQPMNLPTSLRQRAALVDEIWHAAGVQGSDIDWYMKRTVLGGIYSTSEVYMVTDYSPEFRYTWSFVERRIRDAFDLQKTAQELLMERTRFQAASVADAVGQSIGNSMRGFVNRLFQG